MTFRSSFRASNTQRIRQIASSFDRLRDLARESTVIFIGYRLDDFHIRELIYRLEGSRRPRWYIVEPDAEDYDIKFWATKNVEVIKCRFGQFMDAAIRGFSVMEVTASQRCSIRISDPQVLFGSWGESRALDPH